MTPPKNHKHLPEWRSKPWASQAAKRAESQTVSNDHSDEINRHEYISAPWDYVKKMHSEADEMVSDIDAEVKSNKLIAFHHDAQSQYAPLQKIINEVAEHVRTKLIPESGRKLNLAFTPNLYLSTADSDFYTNGNGFAWLVTPEHLITNVETGQHFLNHPQHFRATIAHELAHTFNGDLRFKNILMQRINKPTQIAEVLADRMGALIHGNPREYAKAMEDSFAYYGDLKEDIMTIGSRRYPSAAKRLRGIYHWADILDDQGVIDKSTGQITDYAKAMDIFEDSKKISQLVDDVRFPARQR